ncbi:MAG: sulfite exporter TauE/SafE family protein, partial [Aquificota bacterium]
GTIPAMFFSSFIFNRLSPSLRKKLASSSGLIVILFGVLAILRAFGIGHHH